MNGLKYKIQEIAKKLWFKSSLFSSFSLLVIILAYYFSNLLPEWIAVLIGADSAETILKIIASSMLVVTTFSLAIMISSYSSAANQTSPRVTKILIEDSVSQNSLSTFLGVFIFSLISLVAVETGYYEKPEKAIIFLATILMIVLILVTFFRWIDYLSSLGRIVTIITKVEDIAISAVKAHCESPFLGGVELESIPPNTFALKSKTIGYLHHIEIETLSKIAKKTEGKIYLAINPGAFVTCTSVLAYTTWEPSDNELKKLDSSFVTENERSLEEDPRYGLILLSEIASKALSPGINDPGTAINIIGRIVKVLTILSQPKESEPEILYPNIFVPPLKTVDFFEDSFLAIMRDAAGFIEVGIRLQKGFIHLAKLDVKSFHHYAKEYSTLAIDQAKLSLKLERDINKLVELGNQIPKK